VHDHSLQRWSIILLLIARLVLGEFASAMPHHTGGDITEADVVQSQEMPCPEHAAEPTQDAEDLASKPRVRGGYETHCCKSGCDCVCVHLSGAMFVSAVSVAALEQHPHSAAALGHTPHRIFLLFRPPA